MPRAAIAGLLAALGATAGWAAASPPPAPPPPLIGANYSNTAIRGCDIEGTGIVAGYDRPGVRARVQRDLAAMRAAHLDALRVLLWHERAPAAEAYGVVASAGGVLSGQVRANLALYLADVRDAGFRQLEVSFAPRGANLPGLPQYDPGRFAENLALIADVRSLLYASGIPAIRVDLLNEGPPSEQATPLVRAQRAAYLTRLYRAYVDRFGNADVTLSVAVGRFPPDGSRLRALARVLRASGRPPPPFLELHVGYGPARARVGLARADAILGAAGLRQPFTVGETAYEAPAIAAAIAGFVRASPRRRVLEVLEWPLRANRPCRAISVDPPYRADAYRRALARETPGPA